MIPAEPAGRHRAVAQRFSVTVAGVSDWTAPAPVPGWAAADVVAHLIDWSTGFLAAGGLELPANRATAYDARWDAHVASVQALLDGPSASRDFDHPVAGTHPLADALDRFYTSDVFMHTWDLARASGQPCALDEAEAERLLAAMQPLDSMLRGSGQFGPATPVGDEASATDRLMAFVGRTVT